VASRDGGNNDLEKVQTLFECIKLVLDKESWHDAQARDFLLQIFQKVFFVEDLPCNIESEAQKISLV